jgi:hypothetical protein
MDFFLKIRFQFFKTGADYILETRILQRLKVDSAILSEASFAQKK